MLSAIKFFLSSLLLIIWITDIVEISAFLLNDPVRRQTIRGPYYYERQKVLAKITTTSKTTETLPLQNYTPDDDSVLLLSVSEATRILEEFDGDVAKFAKEENIGMGGGVSASIYYTTLAEDALKRIAQAVCVLVNQANQEREEDYTSSGRVKLGICAEDCMEALGVLKSWVPSLKLPRGLLHGMDVDGVPIDTTSFGPAYIKYNTGGAMTFSEMRRMGLGLDSIWKPGDAVLEGYDGDFRGVHINVELKDGVFRQYGVLPLNLFDYIDL